MKKKEVYRLLENIKNRENCLYEIEASFKDFYKYVKLGRTDKEKLQIFIMLYVSKPTIDELENWDLKYLLDYIRETDEYFESDLKYINKCIREIEV